MISKEKQTELLNAEKVRLGITELFELSDEEQDEVINNLSDKERLAQAHKIVEYMQFCMDGIMGKFNEL